MALYIRPLRYEGFTPAAQRDRLEAYARARGFEVVQEYLDPEPVRTYSPLAQRDALLQEIRRSKRRFGAVLCLRADVLGRSAADFMQVFDALLHHRGEVILAEDDVDTTVQEGAVSLRALAQAVRMIRGRVPKPGPGRRRAPVEIEEIEGAVKSVGSIRAAAKVLGVSARLIYARRKEAGELRKLGRPAGESPTD